MTANKLFHIIQVANKRETGDMEYYFVSTYEANYFSFANGEIIVKTPTSIVFDSSNRIDITSNSKVALLFPPYFRGLFVETFAAKFTNDCREYKAHKSSRKCDRIYRVNLGKSYTAFYRKLFKTLIQSANKTFAHYIRFFESDLFAPVFEYQINYVDKIQIIVAPCIVPDWSI